MLICGIDPGKKGVLITLDTESKQGELKKIEFDKNGILKPIDFFEEIDLIILEKPQVGQGWGSTQLFNFGRVVGQIQFSVAESKIPYKLVGPKTWQKTIHKGIDTKLSPKDRSHIAYSQLCPHQPLPIGPRGGKIDHNMIDALLIAIYGIITFGGGKLKRWALEVSC